jgi:hypothetical protein
MARALACTLLVSLRIARRGGRVMRAPGWVVVDGYKVSTLWGTRRQPCGATRLANPLLALLLAVGVAIPSFAAGHGWWSGPQTPGFDQNTVIWVTGTISGVMPPRGGPSTLRLQAGLEVFTVVLCPPWYLDELHADLREGDRVLVEGSKMMDPSGNLHLMAARITNERTGSILDLRDEAGQPRWLRPAGAPRKW